MYESKQVPVHLLLVVMALSIGCQFGKDESVPVSIKQPPPYSYQGKIGRMWGGDNFEVIENGKIHYAFMRGIDTPELSQHCHEEAMSMMKQLARHKVTSIHVIDRDPWKREVCDITIKDPKTQVELNPAIELLENGLAWYDQSDGPYAEKFRDAEASAKEKEIGIWSQSNPVPPWEYWEQQMKELENLTGE